MRETIDGKTSIIKNLKRILKYIFSVDKKYVFILCITTILTGLIPVAQLLLTQSIMNTIQIGDKNLSYILKLTVLYLLIGVIYSIYQYIINYYNLSFSLKLDLNLNKQILKKSSRLSLADYESSETYDLINRAQKEGGNKFITYVSMFASIASTAISVFSYIIILIRFNYKIIIIITIIPIIKFLILRKLNLMVYKITRERTNDSRKAWYITHMITYGDFYKELKIYNLFEYFIKKYEDYIEKFNQQDKNVQKKFTIVNLIAGIIESVIDGFIFVYLIIAGFNNIILIGDVMTYTNMITRSKSSVTSILNTLSESIKESLFIDQIFEFFEILEEVNEGKIKLDNIISIEVENLSYKYENSSKYALRNVNFKIDNNKKIALLGRNGSGKTTLIKLIMGFYYDYEGRILINGIDLKDIDRKCLLTHLSILFQDFSKYEATLKENIAYGNIKSIEDEEQIFNTIKLFDLTDLVNELNDGIYTQLGSWFDNGIELSTGQWQKVALSRAFIKNGDVYILDEPNAALDSITEYGLSELYKKVLTDKIGIIIAHKFNHFSSFVDEIVVLENGEIIEKGTHDELIKNDKRYTQMYNLN